MKFEKQLHNLVNNAVDLSTALEIDAIVLDSISLRGQNKQEGICIIKPMRDYELPFDAIGFGRIIELKKRLSLFKSPAIAYELMDKEDLKNVARLKISEGKTSVAYKCHEPRLIESPKVINDPILYNLSINDDDVNTIIKGISTMGTPIINFTIDGNEEKIIIKISDTEGDSFSHELQTVPIIEDGAPTLSKSYKSKTLRTILTNYIRKDDSEVLNISITKRGVMRITVHDIFIYLFPER